MSLIHRNRPDVDWRDVFGARMFDVPTTWKDLFDDGILEVRIPIDERSNGAKRIPISRCSS